MPHEVAIKENIERRFANRGYGGDEQLWSAISDMELLSHERALQFVKEIEDKRNFPARDDEKKYNDFVSGAREMYFERRGEFFVNSDNSPISDSVYNRHRRLFEHSPDFGSRTILRTWIDGEIKIKNP